MPVADFEAASEILIERFKQQWDILHPTVSGQRDVPVAWPNVEFDPSRQFDSSTQLGWITFTVLTAGAYQASSSGSVVRRRTTGLIEVQVFVPGGSGDRVAIQIADDVIAALSIKTVDGVVIGTAYPTPVGLTDEGFYQVNITTEYRYDTLVSTT